uniref:Gamma-butyrobetaine hydroxylase-like N-terminal domain-containing protein n=1 Tax=Peronospora matthiolae TaxID=2874970 RepID=A0AAV1VE73_9STRA
MLQCRATRSMSLMCRSVRAFSVRQAVQLENQVLEKLRGVSHGLGMGDIVSSGRVKDLQVTPETGQVACKIEMSSPVLKELAEQWQLEAKVAVKELAWVKMTDFELTKARPRNARAGRLSSLAHVSDIIAVSSCKGGVGKSTVAVNLAFSLAKRGARVGILDADIYGPSLPTMISPVDRTIRPSRKVKHFVEPVEYEGVKCMSFGFVNQRAAPGAGGVGAAVMRGPMVSKLVDQLVLGTEWGDLDYLVVDMPPGTGDIQISLSQQMAISAAVVVTTPQRLSFVDVEKGIAMFDDLKVKTAAVVENMSYFDCSNGQRYYPFGPGHTQELVDKYNMKNVFKLPITEHFSSSGDSGRPFVLSGLSPDEEETYDLLATTVAKELVVLKHNIRLAPDLLYDKNRGIVLRLYSQNEAKEAVLHPADLRARCRCAQCVGEFTGEQILDPATIPDSIVPTAVERKGNYAFAVTWSDGHTSSLYTYDALTALIAEYTSKSAEQQL